MFRSLIVNGAFIELSPGNISLISRFSFTLQWAQTYKRKMIQLSSFVTRYTFVILFLGRKTAQVSSESFQYWFVWLSGRIIFVFPTNFQLFKLQNLLQANKTFIIWGELTTLECSGELWNLNSSGEFENLNGNANF